MMQRRRVSAAALSRSSRPTGSGIDYVEYHPSMSLEHPSLAEMGLLPLPVAEPGVSPRLSPVITGTATSHHATTEPTPASAPPTLAAILRTRHSLWSRVEDLINTLTDNRQHAMYNREVDALRQLQQLHLLCKQRETHLRTLQLIALQQIHRQNSQRDTNASEELESIDPVSTMEA